MQNKKRKALRNNGLTITKLDLTESIQRNVGLTKMNSALMVDRIFSLVTESLEAGNNVKLANFGTFQLIDKASRIGRNPKTNETVSIAPRRVVTFKASSKMSERVIKSNTEIRDNDRVKLSPQKIDILNTLGNKIGTNKQNLEFIFKSSPESQVQKSLRIPDVRDFETLNER